MVAWFKKSWKVVSAVVGAVLAVGLGLIGARWVKKRNLEEAVNHRASVEASGAAELEAEASRARSDTLEGGPHVEPPPGSDRERERRWRRLLDRGQGPPSGSGPSS